MGLFTVIGMGGNPYTVQLFPSQSCTCPSTTICYHIIGARMSIGLDVSCQQQKVNLSQLRRNTRSRPQKRSGRKAPRKGDYEVVCAPDSEESLFESMSYM